MNNFDIIYSLLVIALTLITLKIVKWLFNYVQLIFLINKIPGLQMVPFIGNGHNIKKKHGIKVSYRIPSMSMEY